MYLGRCSPLTGPGGSRVWQVHRRSTYMRRRRGQGCPLVMTVMVALIVVLVTGCSDPITSFGSPERGSRPPHGLDLSDHATARGMRQQARLTQVSLTLKPFIS